MRWQLTILYDAGEKWGRGEREYRTRAPAEKMFSRLIAKGGSVAVSLIDSRTGNGKIWNRQDGQQSYRAPTRQNTGAEPIEPQERSRKVVRVTRTPSGRASIHANRIIQHVQRGPGGSGRNDPK